jgi:hypothetical protein
MNLPIPFLYIESFRIVPTTNPLKCLPMFRMMRIPDRFEKTRETVNPTTVLRRTGTLAGNDPWVPCSRHHRLDLLQDDVVLPPVTKIILVAEKILRSPEYFIKPHPSLVLAIEREFRIGQAVQCSTNLELVQMAVGPSHDCLKDFVEARELDVRSDADSPPDRRAATAEGDLQLEYASL